MRLRDGQFVEDFLNDGFAGFLFGFGFVGDGDAVAEDVHADGFDVLRGDVTAPAKESEGLGGEGERDGRARRSAELDQALELNLVFGGIARGANDVDDVILHFIIDVDFVNDLTGVENLFWVNGGTGLREV